MIFDMSVTLMNSFIFEMIYCKRPTKNAPKAIADSCDICTNHGHSVTIAMPGKIDAIDKTKIMAWTPVRDGSGQHERPLPDDCRSKAERSLSR